MTKIRVKMNSKIKRMSIEKILDKQKKLIERIARKWIKSFSFDGSIGIEDLQQDLNIKIMKSIEHYNSELSSLPTYINKIAKNYFLNKKVAMISKNGHPVDSLGRTLTIKSLFEEIIGDDSELILLDTIKSEDYTPEDNLHFNQLVKAVQKALDNKKFKPKEYTVRLRTFPRILFDSLFYGNEKLREHVMFKYRCRVRNATTKGLKIPNKRMFVAKSIGSFFGVKTSSINVTSSIIKRTIIKCSEDMMNNKRRKNND